MRTLPAPLAAHIAGTVTTLAACWRVERTDGVLILGSQHDRDITISSGALAGTYVAQAGITGSDVRSTSDMSVDNLEVTGAINQGDLSLVDLSAADIEAGLFDDAEVTLFLVNWEAPDDGQIVLRTGNIGAITRTAEGQYRTELRGLAQRLSQGLVRTYGSSCDAELGDFRCKVDLEAYTFDGTVGTVTNNRNFVFTLNALIPTDAGPDFFNGGLVRFASGENAGFSMEVKTAVAGTGALVTETLDVAGAGSWVAPADVLYVQVEAWGAGGGGGGNTNVLPRDGGGGGGGGAYARSNVTVVPGNSYAYVVGAKGVGGIDPAESGGSGSELGGTGLPGGDTSWEALVVAKGGQGGAPAAASEGGLGGTGGQASASTGDVKFSGGNGGVGRTNADGRGGPGGSSAGTAANGLSGGTSNTTNIASLGPDGSGIGGNGGAIGGSVGFAPVLGKGGGGGGASDNTPRRGGDGADGKIVLSYTTGQYIDVTLYMPMPLDVQAGDTFTIQPGCNKSGAMCKGRFNNLVNFRGHGALVPGIGDLGLFGGQTGSAFGRAVLDALWLRFDVTPDP